MQKFGGKQSALWAGSKIVTRTLKHQMFLIRERHGWPRYVLFLCYEGNIISDEEFLLLCEEYSLKDPEFEPLVST